MLSIEKVEKNQNIEYAAFFDDAGTFNLVSNWIDDNPYILTCGDAGLILLNKTGVLIEIELLFANPIKSIDYPIIDCKNIVEGLPFFNINKIEKNLECPILFIKKEERICFLRFANKNKHVDQIVLHNNVRFLLNDEVLIGIEIAHIIFDANSLQQTLGLTKNKANF